MTYIYQHHDWPRFTWDTEALAQQLGAARLRQGRLLGRMSALGLAFQDEAMLSSLTEEAIKTSEIEGEILDADQVRSSVARHLGLDVGGASRVDRHVDGLVEMMMDATQNHGARLTAERLHAWHGALFPTGRSGLKRIRTAAWRDAAADPMQVISGTAGRERVHFEAPRAEALEQEMSAFLDWYNGATDMDGVLKAALAHLWFVTLHPFEDGNGRVARAIADMALAQSEKSGQRFYSMSAQIRAERKAYYDILERTQKGGLDITPWLTWFLGCLDRAFAHAEKVLATVIEKSKFWERHAAVPFNARQRMMLTRLLEGFAGKLTSSKWAKLGKCSQDTAGRDIDELVQRGILVKDAAGGRSTSYSLKGL
ncbi:MAG: Fic family protein [Prosthecobacter sp.]|nr:Fic family protein [Prosthecobacter sp.]